MNLKNKSWNKTKIWINGSALHLIAFLLKEPRTIFI